jgi:hypothetical protein
LIARYSELYGAVLIEAIRATFGRRGTPMPASTPLALTQRFAAEPDKDKQWHAFLTKAGLKADSLEDVLLTLSALLGPPINAAAGGLVFDSRWNPQLRRWI